MRDPPRLPIVFRYRLSTNQENTKAWKRLDIEECGITLILQQATPVFQPSSQPPESDDTGEMVPFERDPPRLPIVLSSFFKSECPGPTMGTPNQYPI
jgi:hypothetical protein